MKPTSRNGWCTASDFSENMSQIWTKQQLTSLQFISPRTVQYHLHKVFQKLDISSRNQLGLVPPSRLGVA